MKYPWINWEIGRVESRRYYFAPHPHPFYNRASLFRRDLSQLSPLTGYIGWHLFQPMKPQLAGRYDQSWNF